MGCTQKTGDCGSYCMHGHAMHNGKYTPYKNTMLVCSLMLPIYLDRVKFGVYLLGPCPLANKIATQWFRLESFGTQTAKIGSGLILN